MQLAGRTRAYNLMHIAKYCGMAATRCEMSPNLASVISNSSKKR